ncbi:cation:proton antiporter [Thermococcus peptonophilus]|uniref:Cation:proton antiporter n=1 Tax=Thermococcus peptonophilus TaxID=53952 RepID=A0A142CTF0_9EURY|nr:proton-conducting transporter membrane subunit [Thermococcus peptonophilus]AMQ18052.1 cation:proton antiporter [Thermococcus peptonophilus]
MIAVLVALPLLFAFLTALTIPLRMEKYARYFFLAGALFPWLVYLLIGEGSEVVGGWPKIGGIEVALDTYNSLLVFGELILFSAVALYSIDYFKKDVKPLVLLLLVHAGLLGAFISRDLFNFYIFMEIASVSAFSLVGFSGGKEALKAAYKYLMLSLLASYFFVFSIGIIYLKTGYLNLELISQSPLYPEVEVAVAVAFTSLLLKAGIFPLHTWLPDAHANAPSPVSALLSGAVVKAPAYGMVLLSLYLPLQENVKNALIVLAFSSMFFGVGVMLLERDIKRFLAYSTVSQMGYVLLGIATLNPMGAVYYAFAHMLFKGGLFLAAGVLVDKFKTRKLEKLSYRGDPILMVSILTLSLAIGGIWPFVGSPAKAALLKGLPYGKELFYVAGLGTLISFTKLNYYLMRGKRRRYGFTVLPSLIMALAALFAGISLGGSPKAMDACLLLGGVVLFLLLKASGLLGVKLPKREMTPKEVNIGAALFSLFLLLLLYLSQG